MKIPSPPPSYITLVITPLAEVTQISYYFAFNATPGPTSRGTLWLKNGSCQYIFRLQKVFAMKYFRILYAGPNRKVLKISIWKCVYVKWFYLVMFGYSSPPSRRGNVEHATDQWRWNDFRAAGAEHTENNFQFWKWLKTFFFFWWIFEINML